MRPKKQSPKWRKDDVESIGNVLGSLYILTVRCKYNEAETMWVWRGVDMHKRRDRCVFVQAIQDWQEVFEPKITHISTKSRNLTKPFGTDLRLIITNRSCMLDTENKNKKPVKSSTEGHGHSLKKSCFFFRPNEPAWNFHAPERGTATLKNTVLRHPRTFSHM